MVNSARRYGSYQPRARGDESFSAAAAAAVLSPSRARSEIFGTGRARSRSSMGALKLQDQPGIDGSLLSELPLRGSVAEWLACWTQAQKAKVQIAVATLSDNSLRQTVRTHCASVHQAAKLVAALLRIAGVTAGLTESNGSLRPGL